MKTACRPHQVSANGESTALERVPLGGNNFAENRVQELLHQNPSILPVSRFDGAFGPIVSLGREIRNIDNLFISPSGRLTVVETKLWRNPQAVREVLAQILEYASKLSLLSCEELEAACHDAKQSPLNRGESLYEFVDRAFPGQVGPEPEFLDRLQRTLKQGRFLLLVVGDGIRENLENVLGMLYGQSHLAFTFGLVELEIYSQPNDKGYLIVPSIPAHSVEVVRAIVKVSNAGSDRVTIEVPPDEPTRRRRLSEQDFLDSMDEPESREFAERLFDWAREHARILVSPKSGSVSVRVPFSTTSNGLILLRLKASGEVVVTPPRLRLELKRAQVGDQEIFRVAESLQKMFPDLTINPDAQRIASSLRADEIVPKMDEFLKIYTEAIKRLRDQDPRGDSASLEEELEDEDESEQDHSA